MTLMDATLPESTIPHPMTLGLNAARERAAAVEALEAGDMELFDMHACEYHRLANEMKDLTGIDPRDDD